MDQDNPAVASQIQMPPALLQEFVENHQSFRDWCHKLLGVNIDSMFLLLRNPAISMRDRLAAMEFLAKMADLYPKTTLANGSAGGPMFSININMDKKKDLPVVERVDVEQLTQEAQEAVAEGVEA